MISPSDLPSELSPSVGDCGTLAGATAGRTEKRTQDASKPGNIGLIRVAALVIALIPISLLGVSSALEPSSNGLGTHQQLGLPPCSMRVLFGLRCPGCGMTTSWAHFSRGEFLRSANVNTGGFLLAVFSILVACLSLRTFWTARLPSVRTQQTFTITLVVIAIVTLLDWVMRLIG